MKKQIAWLAASSIAAATIFVSVGVASTASPRAPKEIGRIYFDLGQPTLSKREKAQLTALLPALKNASVIEVGGYAGTKATPKSKVTRLSTARAQKVADFLALKSNGLSATIRAVSKGYATDTKVASKMRRVIIRVLAYKSVTPTPTPTCVPTPALARSGLSSCPTPTPTCVPTPTLARSGASSCPTPTAPPTPTPSLVPYNFSISSGFNGYTVSAIGLGDSATSPYAAAGPIFECLSGCVAYGTANAPAGQTRAWVKLTCIGDSFQTADARCSSTFSNSSSWTVASRTSSTVSFTTTAVTGTTVPSLGVFLD